MVTARKKDDAQETWTKRASIEWVTENGYCIVRSCEMNGRLPDGMREYCFIVRSPDGSEREAVVEFDPAIIAGVQRRRQTPLPLRNSFWVNCAERSLATYLWEEDECPPSGRLILRELCPDELEAARRCDSETGF